jgi:hypothetical protein
MLITLVAVPTKVMASAGADGLPGRRIAGWSVTRVMSFSPPGPVAADRG